jgi:Tfp pilus assembly protein PilN
MKKYIDLLPESRKKEIKDKRQFVMIVWQGVAFLFPALVFVSILVSIFAILGIERRSLEKIYSVEDSREEFRELEKYENAFDEANRRADLLEKIQKNHLRWSGVLTKIAQIMPESVYVSDISTKDYSISVKGKARLREDLLNFEKAIGESDCFYGFNNPLSNLVSKEDVAFQVGFMVKEKCVKGL